LPPACTAFRYERRRTCRVLTSRSARTPQRRRKVLNGLDGAAKRPRPRSVEIRTDRGKTATPDRCVTSYEFNRKAHVPTPVRIRNPVSVYGKLMTGRDVAGLLDTNGWFKEQVRRLEKSARVTEYSALHVPVFELAASSSTGRPPRKFCATRGT